MSKKWITIVMTSLLMIMGAACEGDEMETPDRFNELYVVGESKSLPYDDSWQQLNPSSLEDIGNDVVLYNQDESYLIVDNEGNKMTGEEYKRNEESPYSISDEFVEKIKNKPLFIVKEGRYYVTTAEKEIIALFEEKRKVSGGDLEKILEDNKEAYQKKDYQAINNYLHKEGISVWKSFLE